MSDNGLNLIWKYQILRVFSCLHCLKNTLVLQCKPAVLVHHCWQLQLRVWTSRVCDTRSEEIKWMCLFREGGRRMGRWCFAHSSQDAAPPRRWDGVKRCTEEARQREMGDKLRQMEALHFSHRRGSVFHNCCWRTGEARAAEGGKSVKFTASQLQLDCDLNPCCPAEAYRASVVSTPRLR